WTIETMSTPKFESTAITSQSPTIALYGLILSTVVACFVWVMGHSRARAIDLADRMTEDLRITAANLLVSNDTIAQKNAALGALADRAHRVVDDVSHEFRTPLAVIKEFTSIITDGLAGPITEDQANYLKIIDGSVLGLNQMEIGRAHV